MKDKIKSVIQTNVPILLWGLPGIGKTATISQVAKELNVPLETVIVSDRDPTELVGLRAIRGESVVTIPPDWATNLVTNGGILFLDELSCASRSQQAAALRLINERVVGNLRLPFSVKIIAAANPPEYSAGAFIMTAPTANRFCHLDYKVDYKLFIEEFPSYWNNPPQLDIPEQVWGDVRSKVAGFINTKPALLLKPSADTSKAWPSPRTWDFASRMLAMVVANNGYVEHGLDLMAGCIGEGPAVEFLTWLREADLPDPSTFFGESIPKLPARTDLLFTILTSVSTFAISKYTETKDKFYWSRAWEVMLLAVESYAPDVAAVAAKQLVKTKLANKWNLQVPPQILSKLGKIIL